VFRAWPGSSGSPKSLNVLRSRSAIGVPVKPKKRAFGSAERRCWPVDHVDVVRGHGVLVLAGLEPLRRVNEQHLADALGGLLRAEDEQGDRD